MGLQIVREADACISHDRGAAAWLHRGGRVAVAARAVELVAVEGMVAAELVAHLMRHVVYGVEVTGRRRDAGAAASLVRAAHDSQVGDAAAGLAKCEVADVVIRRADDLPDHKPRAGRAGAAGHLRLREAAGRATGSIWPDRLRPRVQVEQIVVIDQHHEDREIVLIDLIDPVHQRDLRRSHIR